MPDKKIKAVLFDLGETLLNFGKVNTAKIFRTACKLSYDFLKSCNQPVGNFWYYWWRNLIGLRIRYLLSNITKKDFDSQQLLKKVNSKKGIRLSEQQWQHLAWLWYEPLSKVAWIEPDLTETLAKLKNLNLKLGIVSNTFVIADSLEKHLQQLGLLKFFSVRVYSYEFDFRKPDIRIFNAAAEKAGVIPADIMFVGDRIDNDIKPAIKTGMTAVLKTAYTNLDKKVPPDAHKINFLAQLPALIEKINATAPQYPMSNP